MTVQHESKSTPKENPQPVSYWILSYSKSVWNHLNLFYFSIVLCDLETRAEQIHVAVWLVIFCWIVG